MPGIIITAAGVAAIFLGGRAYLRNDRWSRLGVVIMPIGLAVAAVGALLLFIPDFFGSK